ncbi:TetR/AcrR family transcriptional regulator [Rhodococcus sp. ARC_M6]|uniref:TetR/AcrR family transcriptional regulator n=1 Tax=Rhodococcus sp. ARC_M6 TaxID=2928852 RepID=UPI001FB45397|nr:TetR/AcrR family transcriptional regulator [Rhodococcus sp. ARC_M6]MCJ0902801.1 TetR/AcrR family transcriptional regulator [Rhodococcus sp. ARC_M6]
MQPQERRRQILDCAAEVFASKGIAASTVREIADSVGVYSGTLYHYFPSKDALVVEIIREYLDDLWSRCNDVMAQATDPVDRLAQLIEAALDSSDTHRGATAIWQNEGEYMPEKMHEAGLGTLATDVENAWLTTIDEGLSAGTFRTDIDSRVFYKLIRDAVWLSTQWHRPTPEYSNAALAADVRTLFIDGFRAGRNG